MTVLIVDDDPDTIQLVIRCLSGEQDFKVLSSDNGHDAMRMAQEDKPDLILLDIMMPEPDGLEVCNMLQGNSETSTIPVVMLTARSDTRVAVESFHRGAVNYITKPFDPPDLLDKIRQTLRKRRARAALYGRT